MFFQKASAVKLRSNLIETPYHGGQVISCEGRLAQRSARSFYSSVDFSLGHVPSHSKDCSLREISSKRKASITEPCYTVELGSYLLWCKRRLGSSFPLSSRWADRGDDHMLWSIASISPNLLLVLEKGWILHLLPTSLGNACLNCTAPMHISLPFFPENNTVNVCLHYSGGQLVV